MKRSLFFAALFLSASTIGFASSASNDNNSDSKDLYYQLVKIKSVKNVVRYADGFNYELNECKIDKIFPNIRSAALYALENDFKHANEDTPIKNIFTNNDYIVEEIIQLTNGSPEQRAQLNREFREEYRKLEAAQRKADKLAHVRKMKLVLAKLPVPAEAAQLALTADASSDASSGAVK
jgi:hypothetical protein